jgi:hypothetical protein
MKRTNHNGHDDKLPPKRERFVKEYLIDLNETQAAKRAGYSQKTAHVQGCQLLKDVKVKKAIDAAMERRSKRTEIKADDVVDGLLTEATYYGEGASHAARIRAWELLGRHLPDFFVERHDPTTPPIAISQTIKLDGLPLDTVRTLLAHHRRATGQALGCAAVPEGEVSPEEQLALPPPEEKE